MKTIKAQHKAIYEPVADLITYRAIPARSVPMNLLVPFIFLNHHGRQEYLPTNAGFIVQAYEDMKNGKFGNEEDLMK